MKYRFDYNDVKIMEINGEKQEFVRIIAAKTIYNSHRTINEGEKGGYVAVNGKDTVLSQDGPAWIDAKSMVGQDCYVGGESYVQSSLLAGNVNVGNNAFVSKSCVITPTRTTLFGRAQILNSEINGNIYLSGEAIVDSCKCVGELTLGGRSQLIRCEVTGQGFKVTSNMVFKDVAIKGEEKGRETVEITYLDSHINKKQADKINGNKSNNGREKR